MFGLPRWQVFTSAVASLYFANRLWITDTFSRTDPLRSIFSVSKCTRADRMQSNQQRAYTFFHWSHNGSGRDGLSWCRIWDNDEPISGSDKSCAWTLKISGELPWAAIFMPICCSTDSVALLKFGWLACGKSGCPDRVPNRLSPLHLGARSGLNAFSFSIKLSVLVSFKCWGTAEVTRLVSDDFLFLQVPWDGESFLSVGIIMLLSGSNPRG